MCGRHAFLRFKILTEKRRVREIEPVCNLLDGHLRMAQHTLYFPDCFLPYPFGRGFAADVLYHSCQIFGSDAHFGSVECHASFPAVMRKQHMERMGIRNTQYLIARHFDKEHPHMHIAYNRIDNDGNTISDRNERLRSSRICKELTLKYGLHMANGKENVKRDRLKEPDKTKYELYDILKTEVGRCGNWNVLVANLKWQGVEVRFKHKGQTDEVQGVVFTKNGYHFNGSKVDRCFSYSKIDAALQRNRNEERMRLMPKDYGVDMPNVPSDTTKGELFSGSLGLLNGNASSYNAADAETNQETAEILRRKKKRKRGIRL